jgi:uncharacterized protein YbjT (DUF2867 family)
MSYGLVGTLFRAVVVVGSLAASVYAAMVPLTARSDEIAEMHYLASPGRVTFPELAEDLGYLEGLKLKSVGDSTGGPQSLRIRVMRMCAMPAAQRAVLDDFGNLRAPHLVCARHYSALSRRP